MTLSAPTIGLPKSDGSRPPRRLSVVRGPIPGPSLLCFGGIHGNEPAGVEAIRRVGATLEEEGLLRCGAFVGLSGNRAALEAGARFVDRDLNRAWGDVALPTEAVEYAEHRALADEIDRVVAAAEGTVYALDLHTTSGPGTGFALAADTLPNREFARAAPVPLVLGLEERVVGTLVEHLSDRGVVTAVFEAGQHEDPMSVHRGEAAIWLALGHAGLVPLSHGRVTHSRTILERAAMGLPPVLAVRYRHPVREGDGFRMNPGYSNFQNIREGEVLAHRDGVPVVAPKSGRILMPLYQELGTDGFFIVREFRPFWLSVSAGLRRLGAERVLHLLPGVERSEELEGAIVVDRRRARWYALEIMHLLGFRRVEEEDDRLLVIRRPHDRVR